MGYCKISKTDVSDDSTDSTYSTSPSLETEYSTPSISPSLETQCSTPNQSKNITPVQQNIYHSYKDSKRPHPIITNKKFLRM